MTEKYRKNFAWQSPYGHVVRLVEELGIKPGVVLDLGCGFGAVAEPLAEKGFKYLGIDLDRPALDDLSDRGFDSSRFDLTPRSGMANELLELTAGRQITLVLLLDILEHLPRTRQFLESLQTVFQAWGRPTLMLSLPNVAHFDLGAKLLFGSFDYTTTGLLDETHVSLFTESRMIGELRRFGWIEVGRNDFPLRESDQHFPPNHPGLSDSPLGALLRDLRSRADSNAHVNQFVRAFTLVDVANTDQPTVPARKPFLSVLMRTQGTRPDNLREALTCLAAQSMDDLEVELVVHSGTSKATDSTRAIVNEFSEAFSERVHIHSADGGERAKPLNVGLRAVRGEYVAFLDDDDLVTGSWAKTFKEAASTAPGRIIRSVTVDQDIERTYGGPVSFFVCSKIRPTFNREFDLSMHLYLNQTPICSFAVPRSATDLLHLEFNEDLPVTEDWDFLLRLTQICGVKDTGEVTSIYRRWLCGGGANGDADDSLWKAVRSTILDRLDRTPLLLPRGSATQISELAETKSVSVPRIRDLESHNSQLIGEIGTLQRDSAELMHQISIALSRATTAEEALAGFRRSKSWRLTFPFRWTLHFARRGYPCYTPQEVNFTQGLAASQIPACAAAAARIFSNPGFYSEPATGLASKPAKPLRSGG